MLDTYCDSTSVTSVDYGLFSRTGSTSVGNQLMTSSYHSTSGSAASVGSYIPRPAALSGGAVTGSNSVLSGTTSAGSKMAAYNVGFALANSDLLHQPLQPLTFQGI